VTAADVAEGTALQMPVYQLAGRDVIFADGFAEPVDAQFRGVSKQDTKTVMRRLKRTKSGTSVVEDWEDQLASAVGFIRDYVRAIRRGEFPVMRRGSGDCPSHCEYRTICRYSAWRASKKLGEVQPWLQGVGKQDKP
jgi:hypothetical protein